MKAVPIANKVSRIMTDRTFLFQRPNYERLSQVPTDEKSLDLRRMSFLWNTLSKSIPSPGRIIHIAGTKGKGSTCLMLESIVESSGYSTGLFTSPEIRSIEERIRIHGRASTAIEFDRWLEPVRHVVEYMDAQRPDLGPVTFFEITVAMALFAFAEQNVEAVILETGLGGLRDATNICRPDLTAITSIAIEHSAVLGNTLEQIAFHKAGIIKPGVPVIVGEMPPRALQTIVQIAAQHNAPVLRFGQDFGIDRISEERKYRYWQKTPQISIDDITLSPRGTIQSINAAMACQLALQLNSQFGWNIAGTSIRTALSTLRLPARAEVIRLPGNHGNLLMIDGAHTVESIAELKSVILELQREQGLSRENCHLIFACASDKNYPAMLELLCPIFGRVSVTRFQTNPRSADPETLLPFVKQAVVEKQDSVESALESALESQLIVAAGSFYLAGEVYNWLSKDRN